MRKRQQTMYIALTVAASVVGAALLVFLLVLFLTAPRRHPALTPYLSVRFAHRGLHGEGRAENTLSAFAAAVEAGFGIELDVRLSSDGVPVVFHDDTLTRMTGDPRRVDEVSAAELAALDLGCGEGVPTFRQVLEQIGGRVPLLVEIKEDPFRTEVTDAVLPQLLEYTGPYIVESFNPFTVRRARRGLPGVAVGLLADRMTLSPAYRGFRYHLVQNFFFNFLARPAFVAYNHEHADYFPFRFMRGFWRVPTFAWTVRSQQAENDTRPRFDSVIFEQYIPDGE